MDAFKRAETQEEKVSTVWSPNQVALNTQSYMYIIKYLQQGNAHFDKSAKVLFLCNFFIIQDIASLFMP